MGLMEMDVGSSRTVTVNRRCPGVEDIQIRKEGKNEKNRRQWMLIRSITVGNWVKHKQMLP